MKIAMLAVVLATLTLSGCGSDGLRFHEGDEVWIVSGPHYDVPRKSTGPIKGVIKGLLYLYREDGVPTNMDTYAVSIFMGTSSEYGDMWRGYKVYDKDMKSR